MRLLWGAPLACVCAAALAALLLSLPARSSAEVPIGTFGGHLTLEQMAEYMEQAHANHPTLVSQAHEIGRSVEDRPLLAYCIGTCAAASSGPVPPSNVDATSDAGAAKGSALFTGMHHAREPMSTEVLIFWLDAMLAEVEEKGDRSSAATLLATRQVWMLLVVNPDAYEANRRSDPSGGGWARKNRRTAGGCSHTDDRLGVDLNRNYDFMFDVDVEGSDPEPCEEDYRGPSPFSEPETAAVRDLVEARGNAGAPFRTALNYHSFGRAINVPFSNKHADQPQALDAAIIDGLVDGMSESTGYTSGHAWDNGLYTVNGEASDWMLGVHHIFAFSPEVGPEFLASERRGFWPPAHEVPALGAEVTEATTFMAWAANSHMHAHAKHAPHIAAATATAAGDCPAMSVTAEISNRGVQQTEAEPVVAWTTAFVASAGHQRMLGSSSHPYLRGSVASLSSEARSLGPADEYAQHLSADDVWASTAFLGIVVDISGVDPDVGGTAVLHSTGEATAMAPMSTRTVTMQAPACGVPQPRAGAAAGHFVIVTDGVCTLQAVNGDAREGPTLRLKATDPVCNQIVAALAVPPTIAAASATGGSSSGDASRPGSGDRSSETGSSGDNAHSASSTGSGSGTASGSNSGSGSLPDGSTDPHALEGGSTEGPAATKQRPASLLQSALLAAGVLAALVLVVVFWYRRRMRPSQQGFSAVTQSDGDVESGRVRERRRHRRHNHRADGVELAADVARNGVAAGDRAPAVVRVGGTARAGSTTTSGTGSEYSDGDTTRSDSRSGSGSQSGSGSEWLSGDGGASDSGGSFETGASEASGDDTRGGRM